MQVGKLKKILDKKTHDVSFSEYMEFAGWGLRNPAGIATVIECLIERYLNYSDYRKHKLQMDSIVSTIYALVLYSKDLDPDTLRRLRTTWDQVKRKEDHDQTHEKLVAMLLGGDPASVEMVAQLLEDILFVSELRPRVEEEGKETSKSGMARFASMLKGGIIDKLTLERDEQTIEWLSDRNGPKAEIEYTFIYDYLHQHLQRGNRLVAPDHIDCILTAIQLATSHYKSYPRESRNVALASLHIVDQLTTHYTIPSIELIKTILFRITSLICLSNPVSGFAVQIHKKLINECKCPGWSSICLLRGEFPAIDLLREDLPNADELDVFVNYNKVFCVIDDRRETSLSIVHNNLAQKSQEFTAEETRLMIILYLIGSRKQFMAEIASFLLGLSPREHFTIYTKIVAAFEASLSVDRLQDAVPLQSQAIDVILREIKQLKPSTREPSRHISKSKIEFYLEGDKVPIPPFPPYQFSVLTFQKGQNDLYNELMNLLNRQEALDLPLHFRPLKILIFGGDLELHNFVGALFRLYSEVPNLLYRTDLRIYLVPTKLNHLARLIAERDCWYARHIYATFRIQPFIPRIEESDDIQKGSDPPIGKEKLMPYDIKERLLQYYLREAMHSFNVKIGVADCIGADGNKTRIAFFQSVEVGFAVNASALRNGKNLPRDMSVQELLSAISKVNSAELRISSNKIRLDGTRLRDDNGEELFETVTRTVSLLQIMNMNVDSTYGTDAFPNSEWYQMTYMDAEAFKVFRTAILSKEDFKKYDYGAVKVALEALMTRISGDKISLVSTTRAPFQILVDGKEYGPFVEVHIAPFVANAYKDPNSPLRTTKPVQLSVMTFLPVTL